MKLQSDIIIQPLISEKASKREQGLNEYAIVVDPKATKVEIAAAVEKLFGVKPLQVRTVNFRKKARRNKVTQTAPKSYKKALVRLPEGKRLEIRL